MDGRAPIGFEIRSLNNLIIRNIEKAFDGKEADGITATNGWIIGFLAANPDRDIYQRDLEAEFSITRSTASKVLILMEKKGLIDRKSVAHDARLKRLTLTEKGKKISRKKTGDIKAFEHRLTKGLTGAEVDFLHTCILKMKANLG